MQTLLFPSSHSPVVFSWHHHSRCQSPPAFPQQLSPRPRRTVTQSSKGDADGRDWGGGTVDEDMVVLRKRIHEVRVAEDGGADLPPDWTEWEKEYYEYYVSGVCEFVGLLQTFLMNTRPGLAVGLTIVNWRNHLKFPEEAKLLPEAKDLISKLLCNVDQRLGTKGAHEIKAHPWFRGTLWNKLYQMEAAFIPEVLGELDTQNFEKFEESATPMHTSAKSGPWRKMLPSKDVNFVGYTYKNFEIVNDHQVPGIVDLKKKSTKPKRPTIKSLFESTDTPDQPAQGSFLNLLPTQMEVSESLEPSPHSSISSPEQSQARHR